MDYTFPQFTNVSSTDGFENISMVEGRGFELIDEDGDEYIDLKANSLNVTLGYSQSRIFDAIDEQLRTLPYTDSQCELRERLAERLLEISGHDGGRVGFTTGGSLAIEKGIKLVRDISDRDVLLSFSNGYHGSTFEAGKLNGLEIMYEPFSPGAPQAHNIKIEPPTAFDSESDFLHEFERTVADDDIAAFVAEPYISSFLTFISEELWNDIAEICREHSVYIIFDEIITGMGRTGSYLVSENFDFTPDIVVTGKGLTSGYQPLAATMISEEIISHYTDRVFMSGFTNHGDPPACAAGLETLSVIEDRDFLSKVRRRGAVLKDRLHELEEHELVDDVRGEGLLQGLKLTRSPSGLVDEALDEGVLIKVVEDNLILSPPFVIDEDGIQEGIFRLRSALSSVA